MKRREFIKLSAATGIAGVFTARTSGAAQHAADYFGLHPFIEENPDAVFIMRTHVDSKLNSEQKLAAGAEFAQSVFVTKNMGDKHAFPLSSMVAMKPNLTAYQQSAPADSKMGIVTDPYFVEGLIEGMKTLGLPGSQFHMREVNGEELVQDNGYAPMALRTGANLLVKGTKVTQMNASMVVWKDVPGGIYFSKLPYLWPINAPDTFLLNIAKFKAHGMGLTMAAKNLQGSICRNYQAHCTSFNTHLDMNAGHRNPNASTLIRDNYLRHRADGIPRWDKPGNTFDCGHGMEAWATRCVDNNSVTKPELHIVEGIYGHDGNFATGPHNGKPKDFMSNIIMFGKNPFHVDSIGHWLGGHEPGNFGLLHIAIERGLSKFINPADIPVYEWSAATGATLKSFSDFERTPLLTYYLQRDYDGQNEPYWHLCDEPYDYASTAVTRAHLMPETFELRQNYPNPFNGGTTIDFTLPTAGHVRLEVLNSLGQTVDVLQDHVVQAGRHMVTWRAETVPSGHYFYRCWFEGNVKTGRMLLVR